MRLLTEAELSRIERDYSQGLTTDQIIEIFAKRGIKLSAATFRKYVQEGLLPKSTRVGQKGKHKGSRGVYPSRTVRRLNEIKRWVSGERTLEELANSVFALQRPIDSLDDALDDVLESLQRLVNMKIERAANRNALDKSIGRLRAQADELLQKVCAFRDRLAELTADTDEQSTATRRRTA